MRVIAHRALVLFYQKHSDAQVALEAWFEKTSNADWLSFADIKRDFNSVDSVGGQHYVFNIRGNNYRLIVVVKFRIKLVYIRFIGTHAEYGKIDSSKI